MTEDNLPTPDEAAGKRRRRLLVRKRFYQRLWGGRTANETPVIVFMSGSPDIGHGYIVDAFERNFETDVYRSDDARAFDNGLLRSEDVLRRLIARSRAPAMVFVAGRDVSTIGSLVEHFSPARALWFYQDYRRFIAGARRRGNTSAARARLKEIVDNDSTVKTAKMRLPEELADVVNDPSIDDDAVWALVWYAQHSVYRNQRLDRRNDTLLVAEHSLVAAPKQTMNWLFEIVGVAPLKKHLSRRVKTTRHDKYQPTLSATVEQACDELLTWLAGHSVDATEHS